MGNELLCGCATAGQAKSQPNKSQLSREVCQLIHEMEKQGKVPAVKLNPDASISPGGGTLIGFRSKDDDGRSTGDTAAAFSAADKMEFYLVSPGKAPQRLQATVSSIYPEKQGYGYEIRFADSDKFRLSYLSVDPDRQGTIGPMLGPTNYADAVLVPHSAENNSCQATATNRNSQRK